MNGTTAYSDWLHRRSDFVLLAWGKIRNGEEKTEIDCVLIKRVEFFDRGDGLAGQIGNENHSSIILSNWQFRGLGTRLGIMVVEIKQEHTFSRVTKRSYTSSL